MNADDQANNISPVPQKALLGWCIAGVFVAVTCRLTPLLNAVDLEFSIAAALFISLCAGHLGIRQQRLTPGNSPPANWLTASFAALLPLAFASIGLALSTISCADAYGWRFVALLPVVSAFCGAGIGVVAGLWLSGRWAMTLVIFVVAATIPIELISFFHSGIMVRFSPFFGYFPGPIYDEVVLTTPALIAYRLYCLAGACLLVCAGSLLYGLNQKRLGKGGPYLTLLTAFMAAAALVAVALTGYFGQELGFKPDRAGIQKELNSFAESEHFVYRFPQDSWIKKEIRSVIEDHEFRYWQDRNFLGFDLPGKVKSYLYVSTEQKKRLTGAGETMYGDISHGIIHINAAPYPQHVLKHELLHVMTRPIGLPLLGFTWKIGLLEGIAVACEGFNGDLSGHQWARAMKDLGKAPNLQSIMGPGFWRNQGSRSYLLSGSFVGYLHETYGPQKLAQVYTWGNFDEVYQVSLTQLKDQWEARLAEVSLTDRQRRIAEDRFSKKAIFDKRCARCVARRLAFAKKALREKQFSKAVKLYESAGRIQPENLRIIAGLGQAHLQAEDFPRARELAEQIQKHPGATARQKADARLTIADLSWLDQDVQAARNGWTELLVDPVDDSTERAASARLAALEAEDGDTLLEVLTGNDPLFQAKLGRFVGQHPDNSLGWYLYGRLGYKERKWPFAAQALTKAVQAGLPKGAIDYEARRLQGLAFLQADDLDRAAESWLPLTKMPLSTGKQMLVAEYLERLIWTAKYREKTLQGELVAAIEKAIVARDN